ncbi:hypothetical protein LIER_07720 [Lithospermum erythrorhizon]|uniref:Uncharacterized protein n=1 Tax=Lithospermum erythrorhizon TaxID=34254 RepID=A0AAV3PDU3_LITER
MSSLVTEEMRAKATELYTGDEICQEKSKFLLTEMGLPNGLLPLENIEECGYVESTGFVWLKQKKKKEHKFEKIGKFCQYAPEITAIIEKNRIKKLTGVKVKELLMWVSISDICIDDPASGKITFKTPTGLFRTFPVSAFQLDVPEKKKEVEVKKDVGADAVKTPSKADATEKNHADSNGVKTPSMATETLKNHADANGVKTSSMETETMKKDANANGVKAPSAAVAEVKKVAEAMQME